MALFFVAVSQRDSHDVISKDGQWQYYIRNSYMQDDGVYLNDGSAVTDTVMARWTSSGWEYRKMTPEEADRLPTITGETRE
ncbi:MULTISPECIES: hypothetical protein [unclassified Mesorhizobium]|uniref:hypothetical protein n=1 Tax=unclassified Mesorhizobium TaxID=325217 RepID=UPI000BAF6094|nr:MULTISPECIES: hypothetical protein [unclassified Mesorhizobium]PBC23459.1 hypothetical protein CK226_10045 [Mesorhizobium sp. WSM4311]TRD06824.1 hypothetical protein FJV82_08840 [Mesorhizobium sp. WSM4305]